jgi:hypothetical protein
MPVSVSVEEPNTTSDERDDLNLALQRIENRLDALRRLLPAD